MSTVGIYHTLRLLCVYSTQACELPSMVAVYISSVKNWQCRPVSDGRRTYTNKCVCVNWSTRRWKSRPISPTSGGEPSTRAQLSATGVVAATRPNDLHGLCGPTTLARPAVRFYFFSVRFFTPACVREKLTVC